MPSATGPSPAAGQGTDSPDSVDDASPTAAPNLDLEGIYEGDATGVTCFLHYQHPGDRNPFLCNAVGRLDPQCDFAGS